MHIELRSDTFTLPSDGMLEAMRMAPMGDDVFGEDPSVNALQKYAADLFGVEEALFCASGTMTNQIAMVCHLGPGKEVICDALSHIYLYEGGGIMANAGASVKLLHGDLGRLNAAQIQAAISPDDVHACETALISLENTVNKGGGSVYSTESLASIAQLAKNKGIPLHLDGARLFNAMAVTGQNPKQFGQWFDSISICLSKGLGAPVGSLLLGTQDFIKKAKRVRKRFGGGWRQAGMLAAAGLYALEHQVDRLQEDHRRAQIIGNICQQLPWIESVIPVVTNIVIVALNPGLDSTQVVEKLKAVGIYAAPFGPNHVRFVCHLNVGDVELEAFETQIKKIN